MNGLERRCFLVAGIVLSTLIAGCGSGSGTAATAAPFTQNVQAMTVDAGPANNDFNVGFITVTICAPGTSNCQTIDHISVDTGSSGLRVIASVLSPTLQLAQQTDDSGRPVVECLQFADGYVWGPVKLADLTVSGEQAKSLPVQIIGDSAFPNTPSDCSSSGPAENTVAAFGANGIIGIGNFQQDCGDACATTLFSGAYYTCATTGCANALAPVNLQVSNPVASFATDNNGVLIQLPSVPTTGSASVSGSLIFGIGTQTNNGLGSATVIAVDANTGYLNAIYNNQTYADSFIDSGSSVFFVPASVAQACSGQDSSYFCPPATLNLSATLRGVNGVSAIVGFSMANADALFNSAPTFAAFSNLAGINSDPTGFDFGLPFFYGRNVFTAIENRSTPGGVGPYVAF